MISLIEFSKETKMKNSCCQGLGMLGGGGSTGEVFVVSEQLCILMVVTQIYTCDEMTSIHAHCTSADFLIF